MSEKCLRYWLLGCSEFSAASTSLIYFTCQFSRLPRPEAHPETVP